jgi:hypothetical protein
VSTEPVTVQYGWEKRGQSKPKSNHGKRTITTNAGTPNCAHQKHDYLGTGEHWDKEPAGEFAGKTSKRKNNITC